MKTIAALLLALSLTSGCTTPGTTTPKPHQAEALDLVWRQVYGQDDGPPEVEWHHAADLFGDTAGFTLAGWKVVVADGGYDGGFEYSSACDCWERGGVFMFSFIQKWETTLH